MERQKVGPHIKNPHTLRRGGSCDLKLCARLLIPGITHEASAINVTPIFPS